MFTNLATKRGPHIVYLFSFASTPLSTADNPYWGFASQGRFSNMTYHVWICLKKLKRRKPPIWDISSDMIFHGILGYITSNMMQLWVCPKMMDSHKTEHFYLQTHVITAHLLMNMNFSKTDSQPCVKGSRSQWTTPEQQAESARAGPADTGGKWQYWRMMVRIEKDPLTFFFTHGKWKNT